MYYYPSTPYHHHQTKPQPLIQCVVNPAAPHVRQRKAVNGTTHPSLHSSRIQHHLQLPRLAEKTGSPSLQREGGPHVPWQLNPKGVGGGIRKTHRRKQTVVHQRGTRWSHCPPVFPRCAVFTRKPYSTLLSQELQFQQICPLQSPPRVHAVRADPPPSADDRP